MIKNLGKAISIIARASADEINYHADVSAWGAPGECHDSVSKGEAARYRRARRHAKAVARAPYRIIIREARERGGVELHEHNRHFRRAIEAHVHDFY